ncbi:MAG: phosphoribosylformylglycinamidine synthase subunit PurQ, partial [Octadecabacter sp.]|nr:phosphoribosylformylglycinamidine synthase subunit PurQ [Octadecabacter sp.]
MKAAVVQFPGSNCDRDMAVALEKSGVDVTIVWHKDAALPSGVDLVAIPGGFSFGDYLRCGAIAANSPICNAVVDHANAGGYVLGVCNGFQILTETGLLPGALLRNAGLKYICRTVGLKIETSNSAYTEGYNAGSEIGVPIAHHDGNYFADDATITAL